MSDSLLRPGQADDLTAEELSKVLECIKKLALTEAPKVVENLNWHMLSKHFRSLI